MGLAERWHGREVEAFERLAHGQACLPEMALDAAAITLGQLQLVNRLSILTPNRRAILTPLSGTAEVVPVVNRGDPRGFV